MEQFKIYLKRLRNPSVILSIASQIIAILLLFKINIDSEIIMSVVTGICSILVILGILSDPDTKKITYTDDIMECINCQKKTKHTLVNRKMVCKECGGVKE